MNATIKETDSIFLKIDFTVTNQLKTLIKTNSSETKKEKANELKIDTSFKNSNAFKPLSSFLIY